MYVDVCMSMYKGEWQCVSGHGLTLIRRYAEKLIRLQVCALKRWYAGALVRWYTCLLAR